MQQNRLLLTLLLLLCLLLPLAIAWFRADPAAWYRPQLFWLAVIATTSLLLRRGAPDEH